MTDNNLIKFGEEAQQDLVKGISVLEEAVTTTLGPRGHNVSIDRGYDTQTVHDGVTVAKYVLLKNKTQNLGVRIIREAANEQVEEVGDGTTVVTLLASSIVKEAFRAQAAGVSMMEIRKGLEESAKLVTEALAATATPITSLKQKIQIATISAEEKELGELIAKTIHEIGVDGIVTVEESKSSETYVEHQKGMQFDKGFASPYFKTDLDRNEATVEDTYIVLSDHDVSNIFEIKPLLDKFVEKNIRNLVVIAPDITDSALASFIATKLNGGMNILAVRAPFFNEHQKEFLQDLAILTGGMVISEEAGMRFEEATFEMLGRAQRVTSTKDATTIVGGMGDKKIIEARIASIRELLDRGDGSEFEQEKLKERIAKLSGGVAIIKVGGHTESEMKERKERAIDAVAATKAAVAEGIVPGGEVVYLKARTILDPKHSIAEKILFDALEKPFNKLVQNAGLDAGFARAMLSMSKISHAGYDVTDGEIKDMIKVGIIDPVKVSKSAIKYAVSAAINVITTLTTIVPNEEEEKKK